MQLLLLFLLAPFTEPSTLSPALPHSGGGSCFAFFGPLGQAEPRVQTKSGLEEAREGSRASRPGTWMCLAWTP
jgi:hypothetical protein